MDLSIPKSLFQGQSRLSAANLPYCYPTVKAKCWGHDGEYKCSLPSRSCFRNICSFAHFPAR
eukprot:2411798-Pyramimonas_sp.AAC.1